MSLRKLVMWMCVDQKMFHSRSFDAMTLATTTEKKKKMLLTPDRLATWMESLTGSRSKNLFGSEVRPGPSSRWGLRDFCAGVFAREESGTKKDFLVMPWHQCDKIGLWWKVLAKYFLTKVAKIFAKIWGSVASSVSSKKSANKCKRCPKMI